MNFGIKRITQNAVWKFFNKITLCIEKNTNFAADILFLTLKERESI